MMETMDETREKAEPGRVVETGVMRLTGLAGDFSPETMRDIPGLWQRFVEELEGARLSGTGPRVSYGAGFHCFDASPQFRYLCAVEVRDFSGVPPGWERIEVPARRYAVFTHRGHVSELGDTIEAIRKSWPAGAGRAAEPGGTAPDFLERYGEEFDPVSGKGGMEVWFPVRS